MVSMPMEKPTNRTNRACKLSQQLSPPPVAEGPVPGCVCSGQCLRTTALMRPGYTWDSLWDILGVYTQLFGPFQEGTWSSTSDSFKEISSNWAQRISWPATYPPVTLLRKIAHLYLFKGVIFHSYQCLEGQGDENHSWRASLHCEATKKIQKDK